MTTVVAKRNIGCGLINRRNNCFFNSTIQALFHMPIIANCLRKELEGITNCKNRKCITCDFLNFFRDTQCSENPYNPYRFYDALKKISGCLAGILNGNHQDPHEFLILLTQELENQNHSASWFVKNFTAEIKTRIECSLCGTVHTASDKVVALTLEITGNESVQSSLDSYFKYDVIKEYRCESRGIEGPAKRRHILLSAPNCLCLHLERFTKANKKINDCIDITHELRLSTYFSKTQTREWKYKLVAVIKHFGETVDVGHYNTIVIPSTDLFYEFDDRNVREVTSNMISGSQAYLLFYERIEEISDSEGDSIRNLPEDMVDELDEIEIVEDELEIENHTENIENSDRDRNVEDVRAITRNNSQESDEHINKLSGRRIVDIDYVFNQMLSMTKNICSECETGKMVFTKEVRRGLQSHYTFQCTVCGKTNRVNSCPVYDDTQNINMSSVLGIVSVGLGHYHLEEFLSHVNVPCMSYVTYHKYEENIQKEYSKFAAELEAEALNEEIRLAKENNEVDSAGNALIVAEFDGSWEKRAYRNNFSSLAGCAAILGLRTKKILYSGVKTKYCHICKIAQSRNMPPREHECNRNYEGPSSGMETQIIIDGFKFCAEKGARFHRYIGDGDSSTFKALRDLNLYTDPDINIEKFECINHLFRNFFKQFLILLNSSKIKKYARKLLSPAIGRSICKGVRMAAQHWRKADIDLVDKYANLEIDIMNALSHCIGLHDKCNKYFCTKTTSEEVHVTLSILKETGLYYEVLDLCQSYFANNAKSLIAGYTTNKTEGFNSLIAKQVGGKRICNSLDGSYKLRTKIADVQFNSAGHSGSKIHEYIFDVSSPLCIKMENARKRKCARNVIANEKKPNKRISDEPPSKKPKTKHYGDGREDVDMTSSEFELAKNRRLEILRENQINRSAIEANTQLQHHSFKWIEVRKYMLTSSYFGRILRARNRCSYTNIVHEIVYNNVEYSNTAEMRHQRIYEKQALSIFTKFYPHEPIHKCGIFIDEKLPYIGGTPFRLYGKDGIIVAKCPKKLMKMSMEKALKKISFWKGPLNNRRINYESHWYYEVQGQLHVTKRQMAYLVIYLSENVYDIVEIERNKDFWKKHMEKELIFFYNEALLKELVDPRDQRGMDLRKYNVENETFE